MFRMHKRTVKKKGRINLELPAELKEKIERKADESMLNTSAYIRLVLAQKIKEEEAS